MPALAEVSGFGAGACIAGASPIIKSKMLRRSKSIPDLSAWGLSTIRRLDMLTPEQILAAQKANIETRSA